MDRRAFRFNRSARLREAARVARRTCGTRGTLPVAAGLLIRPPGAALRRSDRAAPRPARTMRWTLLVILAVLALVLGVVLGPAAVPLSELLRSDIVWSLRVPRALLAFLV